jgi:hypothetical protein
LPSIRIGRNYRIRVESLERFLAELETRDEVMG